MRTEPGTSSGGHSGKLVRVGCEGRILTNISTAHQQHRMAAIPKIGEGSGSTNVRIVWMYAAVVSAFLLPIVNAHSACNIVGNKSYGDCGNVTINNEKSPFETIRNHRTVAGLSAGARVVAGGSISVTGIADHIIVEEGASAWVSGIVDRLDNLGGKVEVQGIVYTLSASAGTTIIEGQVSIIIDNAGVQLRQGSVVGGVPTP